MNRLNFNLLFKYFYIAPPVIYSLLTFFAMNTSFECDSNTYFNFAKGNSISLLRGPGYPIFLFLTGMNSSEGSLYFVLFLQWFMGILIVLLVISFLKTNNHLLRFIFSLLISSSGYTFYGARLFLAEQLTMFLSMISIFLLLIHIRNKKLKVAIYSLIFASLAVLTRYESLPVLLGVLVYLIFSYLKLRSFNKLFNIMLIPVLIILGWSFLRSELVPGKTQFGTVANETGTQLMNSIHVAIDNEIKRLVSSGEVYKAEKYFYFDTTYGEATKKAKEIAQNHLSSNRTLFDRKLMGLSQDISYTSEISSIWEPASKEPTVLYEWFFSTNYLKRSPQMILLLNEILVAEIGSEAADKLMVSVSFELIRSQPEVIYLYLKNGPQWYGVDFNKSNKLYLGNKTLSYWDVPFDPANCASAVLSKKQFKEYSDFFSKIPGLTFVQNLVAFNMEIFRILFTLSIILWTGMVLFRKIKFESQVLLLISIHFMIVIFLTVSQVGINSKYTILPGTLSLLTLTLIVNSISNVHSIEKIKKV
jgi:hypothetical protein